MNTWFWIACGLWCGYPVLWFLGRKSWRSIALRATSVVVAERDEAKLALENATQESAAERARLHAELKLVISDLHTERDKVSRYFVKISAFERERDEWQRMYHEQSIGHGNAQSLMMGTIEKLSRQLQEKGVRVQIPKVLHEIREEFLGAHELPAREGVEALRKLQATQTTAETTPPTTP